MSSYGFPTMLQYSRLSASVANTKTRAEETRTEVTTGRIADLKKELGSAIGDTQLLKHAYDSVRATQASGARALSRAQTAQYALARTTDGMTTMGADLLNAVGHRDEQGIRIVSVQAGLQLEAAISALNTRFEGRSLFAGDATDAEALADPETLLDDIRAIFAGAPDFATLEADLDFYFNDPTGGFATTIYTGGAGNAARTEVSEGELLDYSAKADEQPVRDLLRSLSTMIVGQEQTGFADRDLALKAAAGQMIQSANDVISIRARIGAAEERIAQMDERLEAEATALGGAYNDRTARDPYEAASLLKELEAQLEASYIVTSRISQLTLANYFR